MDALLMCGGRGTRLDVNVEKPLFEVAGRPIIDHVRDALVESQVETTYAVVSPHAPETHAHLADDLPVIETAGDGYVADLQVALEAVEMPVFTVAADVPLLEATVVNDVLAVADGSTSVRVPRALKALLGVSVDEGTEGNQNGDWVPTGVNVVDDDEDNAYRSYDARLAVNVNRVADAVVAERLLTARTDAGLALEDVEGDDGP